DLCELWAWIFGRVRNREMRPIEITLATAAALAGKTRRARLLSGASKTGEPGVGAATLASGSGPAAENLPPNTRII
ncbi:MAG: hypothetical protein ACLQIQ_21885, partial [Beijerinckiaceae bacterium]